MSCRKVLSPKVGPESEQPYVALEASMYLASFTGAYPLVLFSEKMKALLVVE